MSRPERPPDAGIQRFPPQPLPVGRVQGHRVHLDQHLVILRHRRLHVRQPKHVRRSIPRVDNSLHSLHSLPPPQPASSARRPTSSGLGPPGGQAGDRASPILHGHRRADSPDDDPAPISTNRGPVGCRPSRRQPHRAGWSSVGVNLAKSPPGHSLTYACAGVGLPSRASLTGRRGQRPPGIGSGQRCARPASPSSGGGLVLLDDAGGDAAAVAERDALVFRPGPEVRAPCPAGRSPPRPLPLSSASPAGPVRCKGRAAGRKRWRSWRSGRSRSRCRRSRTAPSPPPLGNGTFGPDRPLSAAQILQLSRKEGADDP